MKHTKHFQVSTILAERMKYMLPGEEIPTVAALMEEFNASQVTISQALNRLRNQGIVERPSGRKRLIVAQVGERTVLRVSLIRPLWPSPDHDAAVQAVYEAGQEEHWGFNIYTFSDIATLNLQHAIGSNDAAIVLAARTPPAPIVRAFQGCNKPIVFMRDKPDEVDASHVWVDDREVGRMATNHLLELGHRRILVMLSEPPNPSSSQRLIGWREAMISAGEKSLEELIVDCSVTSGKNAITGSYERLALWLQAPRAVFTAMFCVGWTGALAAMRAFREKGMEIPRDVSLITYGSEAAFSAFLNPPLTTVRTDVNVHARETVRLVKEAFRTEDWKPEEVLLRPELMIRESTRALGPRRSKN